MEASAQVVKCTTRSGYFLINTTKSVGQMREWVIAWIPSNGEHDYAEQRP